MTTDASNPTRGVSALIAHAPPRAALGGFNALLAVAFISLAGPWAHAQTAPDAHVVPGALSTPLQSVSLVTSSQGVFRENVVGLAPGKSAELPPQTGQISNLNAGNAVAS